MKPLLKTNIKIEKGIPLPKPTNPGAGVSKIFLKMEIGDSVVLPKPFQRNVPYNAGRLGMKMKTHQISDTEVRIWRTA